MSTGHEKGWEEIGERLNNYETGASSDADYAAFKSLQSAATGGPIPWWRPFIAWAFVIGLLAGVAGAYALKSDWYGEESPAQTLREKAPTIAHNPSDSVTLLNDESTPTSSLEEGPVLTQGGENRTAFPPSQSAETGRIKRTNEKISGDSGGLSMGNIRPNQPINGKGSIEINRSLRGGNRSSGELESNLPSPLSSGSGKVDTVQAPPIAVSDPEENSIPRKATGKSLGEFGELSPTVVTVLPRLDQSMVLSQYSFANLPEVTKPETPGKFLPSPNQTTRLAVIGGVQSSIARDADAFFGEPSLYLQFEAKQRLTDRLAIGGRVGLTNYSTTTIGGSSIKLDAKERNFLRPQREAFTYVQQVELDRLATLDVSLVVFYGIGSRIQLGAGARLSRVLASQRTSSNARDNILLFDPADTYLKRFDVGALGLAEVRFAKNTSIGVEYNAGLSDLLLNTPETDHSGSGLRTTAGRVYVKQSF